MNVKISCATLDDVKAKELLGPASGAVAIRLCLSGLNASVVFSGSDNDSMKVTACRRDYVFNAHGDYFL
jgi:hypothetical protein